jgi:hypothetical protein
LISEDILNHQGIESDWGLSITFQRPFIKDREHLFEVLSNDGIPFIGNSVIDGEENYLGCISRDDLLNFSPQKPVSPTGSILVLEVNLKDYSLAWTHH